ncbi:ABC transporter ATP-binding protein [Rhodococcus erythropolis]|uniref:ABC transporter ATP-binding protein n=1 Tax=Rhodococcus erythropolis TaxID=1833 RepID=UPI002ABE8E50|nr:ABC transporter ATP-binding protein [Rhodococcus qingshengii]
MWTAPDQVMSEIIVTTLTELGVRSSSGRTALGSKIVRWADVFARGSREGGIMNNAQAPAVLSVHALGKSYGDVPVLRGVSLEVRAGTATAIMGPSGSGKSTLLHCMSGIVKPDSGAILLSGRHIENLGENDRSRLRRESYGFVFQSGQLLPELPAIENVALPLVLNGLSITEAKRTAHGFFAPLGLDGLQDRRPGQMSGGQSQRVAIARALVTKPAVLFADEPTGALDAQTSWEVMRVLRDSAQQIGSALVVVTHDAEVARWCDRTMMMQAGSLVGTQVAA